MDVPTVFILCVVIIASHLPGISGDEFEEKLYRKLMRGYVKDIRPTLDHRLATNVTFGFSLHQLIDVDEKNQVITTSSWLNINWMDYNLAWNVSEFGGIKMIHIPHDKVWKPDIVLTNNADPEYKEVVVSTEVYVTNTGNVTWLSFAIFMRLAGKYFIAPLRPYYFSSCHVNVRYYPLDEQICTLTFSSWTHDGDEMNLLLISEEGDMTNFMKNGEWDLISMVANRKLQQYSCCKVEFSVITQVIQLQRRPLFYIFNHVLPCVLITSMSLLGFYVPADTGEKVTMCITTMLSMGVFLKTVNENLPPASEAVPLIGMYYGCSLIIVCMATLINVCTLNVHHYGSTTGKPVPDWLRTAVLGYLARILGMRFPAEERRSKGKRRNAIDASPDKGRFAYIKAVLTGDEEKQTQLSLANQRKRLSIGLAKLDRKPRGGHKKERRRKDRLSAMSYSIRGLPPPINDSAISSAAWVAGVGAVAPAAGGGLAPMESPRHRLGSTSTVGAGTNAFVNDVRKAFESRFMKVLMRVHRTLEENEMRIDLQDRRTQIMWEWRQLATIVDRFLLCLFVFATAGTSVMMLLEPTLADLWAARYATNGTEDAASNTTIHSII